MDPDNVESFQNMANYSFRLDSFKNSNWPSTHPSPEKMAKAGWFYFGSAEDADNVKCPFCLKEMCGWDSDDDPWLDHKRSVGCPMVNVGKFSDEWTIGEMLQMCAVAKKNALDLRHGAYKSMLFEGVKLYGLDHDFKEEKAKGKKGGRRRK